MANRRRMSLLTSTRGPPAQEKKTKVIRAFPENCYFWVHYNVSIKAGNITIPVQWEGSLHVLTLYPRVVHIPPPTPSPHPQKNPSLLMHPSGISYLIISATHVSNAMRQQQRFCGTAPCARSKPCHTANITLLWHSHRQCVWRGWD